MSVIVYLINEDWFFASHFRHLAQSALSEGYEVIVATGSGPDAEKLKSDGLKVVALPVRRRGLRPKGIVSAVSIVRAILAENPKVVLHGFGLFSILVGTLAGRDQPQVRRIYTITGRGYATVSKAPHMKLVSVLSRWLCRHLADTPTTRWIVENEEDIAQSGLSRANAHHRVTLIRGAGVDPDRYVASRMPDHPPLRVAFVARLIWSKGLDIAVAAVTLARSRGADVTLTIAGSADPGNPRPFTTEDLADFAAKPGIKFVGPIEDIPHFWSQHHLAILPSRGGEGVPRSLIEAASCARPILTTDVPGCNELARSTQGWAVPREDPDAAAKVLCEVASEMEQLERRGNAARAAVIARYSSRMVWIATSALYRELSR